MTYWDKLKKASYETESLYSFASQEFINLFTKTAEDKGLTSEEITQTLDKMEKKFKTQNE